MSAQTLLTAVIPGRNDVTETNDDYRSNTLGQINE